MKDNYGEEVPIDLVSLAIGLDTLTDDEMKLIVAARWYEVTHSHGEDLAVSFGEVGYLDQFDDSPIGDTPIEIMRINDCLKRWSYEDGFYHS